jgi:hypothetical protein
VIRENAMDSQPIRDERILEALEVCRPGGDDLGDPALADLADQLGVNPELRALYDRLQRVDARLSAAFREVPVPEGLAQRIFDRLAAAPEQQAAPSDMEEAAECGTTASVAEPAARPDQPSVDARVRRRRLLAFAGILSTGAVLLVAALISLYPRKTYDVPTVLEDAVKLFDGHGDGDERGHLLSDRRPPDDHPFSRDVRSVPGMRWRELSGFLGRSGVAYDLPGPAGTIKATLYVVERTLPDLEEKAPPPRPQRNTADRCAVAWQVGKLLYVLVVRGGSRDYLECLAPVGLVT